MLKPGGWVLFKDMRMVKSMEGAPGVLRVFEAIGKMAEYHERDIDIGL